MNTFQLSCFLAVAETLNFARAAEQLHVTQPAVTQQIHSLERELDVKLFKRTTRTVRLTAEGLSFIGDARQMVAIAGRAVKRFADPSTREIRFLTLGCHSFTQFFLLPQVLGGLKEKYPDLHPRLQVVPFRHLYRLLEDEDVDAVIGFREPAGGKLTAVYREIQKVPVVCVCPPGHPLSRRPSLTAEELKRERLVLFDPAKAPSDVARLQGQLMDGRPPAAFYFCESAETVIILVQAGYGVSVLPALFIPPDLPLACIPLAGVDPVSFGVYYKSVQGNGPLKDFIQGMKEAAGREQ